LTTLREKLSKIGAKVVSHGRYVAFQMAEVAISRKLFGAVVERIASIAAVGDGHVITPGRQRAAETKGRRASLTVQRSFSGHIANPG
jgi:hypothetical protein